MIKCSADGEHGALHQLLDVSAADSAEAVAVVDPSGKSVSYGELADLSNALRNILSGLGVVPGDRVAFCLEKSIDSIVCIYGIMKTGAAYVPLDPNAPAKRNAYIVENCTVRVLITENKFSETLQNKLSESNADIRVVVLQETEGSSRISQLIGLEQDIETYRSMPDDLAYILYTSGSTGNPKGVMISHRNACSFVDWCSESFEPSKSDRFSSHAPLHFDLSIHDVHVSIKHGAALELVDESTAKNPMKLARFIAERKISVWYSTPSILGLMAEFGNLAAHDYSALRLVLFAGEVFPVKHLRAIKKSWPAPRFFNLYGPTETNVCTYYEIPAEVPEDRLTPYPIGAVCSHYEASVVDDSNLRVERGCEGELLIHGPGVTPGYWHLPERTATCFYEGAGGKLWYRTGDIVTEDNVGNYEFLGRRDRMVKKRGYRVELDEVESCLYQHPEIEEVGVVATSNSNSDVRIRAFFKPVNGQTISIISLKTFCAERIPIYMVPDDFIPRVQLPRTSTDKVDYQSLAKSDK